MGSFHGIMICTDLDGTLLRADKSVSRENLDAIRRFRAGGGIFTFITGRMPFFSAHICEKVGSGDTPFGCINGGGVFDPRAGRYLWVQTLPQSVLELVRYVDERVEGIGVQINTPERVYFCRENGSMAHFRQITGMPDLVCPIEGNGEPIAKIVFGDDREEKISEISSILLSHPRANEFGYIRSEKTLFEILPKGISKATALKKLAALQGIDLAHTVALGDYDNDIGMLRAAGVGIAVTNARPEVKAAADLVTVSNEEHAIAKTVEDIECGRILPGVFAQNRQ